MYDWSYENNLEAVEKTHGFCKAYNINEKSEKILLCAVLQSNSKSISGCPTHVDLISYCMSQAEWSSHDSNKSLGGINRNPSIKISNKCNEIYKPIIEALVSDFFKGEEN